MTHSATFKMHDKIVEVEFCYQEEEAETFDSPFYPEVFEITKIVVNGIDCSESLEFMDMGSIIDGIKNSNDERN